MAKGLEQPNKGKEENTFQSFISVLIIYMLFSVMGFS